MKIGIMQPYFFPYIGYWQLIDYVDTFVVYDNIQYTKKGWFNRNRYLLNSKSTLFSINLKHDYDLLNVNERVISPEYKREKLIAKFENAYSKAPYKSSVLPIICEIVNHPDNNLFQYLYNSITGICKYLGIQTKIVISSEINIDHSLRSEEKVIAICKEMRANTYINSFGNIKLYSKKNFAQRNIDLKFIQPKNVEYKQFDNKFVPSLSIIDAMMFNSRERIINMLKQFKLF